jgi:hypothetical protein
LETLHEETLTLRALLAEKERECSTLMRKFDARLKIELNTRRHWKAQMNLLENKLSNELKRGMELESRVVESERVCSLYHHALSPLVEIYQSSQRERFLSSSGGGGARRSSGSGGGGRGSEEVIIPPFWSDETATVAAVGPGATASGRREHPAPSLSSPQPTASSISSFAAAGEVRETSLAASPPPLAAAVAEPPAAFCVVCQTYTADTLLLPCGHLCLCYSHALSMQIDRILRVCPVCKQSCQGISRQGGERGRGEGSD